MSQGLREVHPADIAAELEQLLIGRFKTLLLEHGPGHCMRVTDLDVDLMRRLCARLRQEVTNSQVFVLTDGAGQASDNLSITSTKLVELRNPESGGHLRPPLLVFVPSELRTSSEDSFGVATFADIKVGDAYAGLNVRLMDGFPVSLRSSVQAILHRVHEMKWRWADSVSISRFLLTIKLNDYDADAVGAALWELGLVPDFKLLSEPARAPFRVIRNAECVERLMRADKSERLRVLDLPLAKKAFRAELANFLAQQGLETPRGWTRQIVADRANWRFSFDKWDLEQDAVPLEQVFVEVLGTSLPRVEENTQEERLQGLIGQQILPVGKGGLRSFNVSFRVDPHPSKVEGLARFRLQVVSVDSGPIGIVRSAVAWKSKSDQKTVSFTKLKPDDWEEGWHFVRVQALTSDDEPIPLVDREGKPLPWSDESRAGQQPARNESELFYVLPEGEFDDVEPVQRAIPRYPSLIHAQRDLQFTAVLDDRDASQVQPTRVAWSERSTERTRASQELIEAKFGSLGAVHIPVSHALRMLEQRILESPGQLCTWRLLIHRGVPGAPKAEVIDWPDSLSVADLIEARKQLFAAVSQGDQRLLAEAADFGKLQGLVVEYGLQYQALLQTLLRRVEATSGAEQHAARASLQALLNLDVVYVTLTNHRGERQEAALVGPLHPIRCVWLAGWTALGASWVNGATKCSRESVSAAREVLLERLVPANQPPFVPVGHGRVFAAVDNIHPVWTLYAPNLERDPRGLIGNVCSALGLAEPDIGGLTISGRYLAERVQRYLVQHPYIRVLTINAFNPGRAGVLADMLLELQGNETLQNLRYDLRLFVPDTDSPGVGEALLELLNPEGSVTAKRADVFSALGGDPLDPKLRVAIRPTRDFRDSPDDYPAHLSLLFDVFPAEEVSAGTVPPDKAGAPVFGLLQDFVVDYVDDGQTVAWTRQPRHGTATSLVGAETVTDLLSTLPEVFSAATAAVATGQAGLSRRPQVTLALDNDDRTLIHQVHDVSDWALTIDRNIGIEYFDHNRRGDRPEYLIEHNPSLESGLGHQVLITSRSLVEIEALIRSALEKYELKAEGDHAAAILDNLRCLSGRLALKLISSPTQRSEAIGLALARMYLAHQGIFSNQIVVPLDAHLELYRETRRHGGELEDEIGFRRTDLALFDLNAGTRTVTCNLVEVKCYSQPGGIAGYAQLKDTIVGQLEESEQILRLHFDPTLHTPDRLDRLYKTAELARLLDFYLERSVRFGLLDEDSAIEARFFLRTLEAGYSLAFTRSGLIFDFERAGADEPEQEAGVEFHRIGIDLIRALVEAAAPRPERLAASEEAAGPTELPAKVEELPEEVLAFLPRLKAAAFLPTRRDPSKTSDWSVGRDQVGPAGISEPKRMVRIEYPKPPADELSVALETPDDARSRGRKDNSGPSVPPPPRHKPGPPEQQKAGPTPAPAVPTPTAKEEARHAEGIAEEGVEYDVILGCTGNSPQWGMLGEVAGRKVALDLNQTHTISLFGVQGQGKSYTLGTVVEMAAMPIPHINRLPSRLATVIFHYSPTQDYRPEFTSMAEPNSVPQEIEILLQRYQAQPQSLDDILLLVPADKVQQRQAEFPKLRICPLTFAAGELQAIHWRFLMGAVGNQSVYIRQLNNVMRQIRDDMSLAGLRNGVDRSSLPDHLKDLAHMRLDMAAHFVGDGEGVRTILRPGRLVIVDLRDEFIEKDQALGLFVVLLQLFADAKHEGRNFNKLIVFDEAHKYIDSADLITGLVEVVREMRHKGTTVMVASQDPPSVPVSLIELSTQIILHRFNSPAWLKHIQKANSALGSLTPERLAQLDRGEAYVWSSKASDDAFSKGVIKIKCRPRVTQHGGATRTAIE